MTIADGQTIIASDLDALTTSALANAQTDNAQLPLGFHLWATFHNLVAGSNALYRRTVFVVPFDCYIESVKVQAGDQTAASTVTLALDFDGVLAPWEISISGSAGAGTTELTRLLYDNTKTKQTNVAATSMAFRVLPAGTTVAVTVSTTSVATPSMVAVGLCLREFFARE
jgi:hypothetical protein